MKKKEITIHKKNEFIRGEDSLTLTGKRALNAIYYLIQRHNFYDVYKFKIKFATLRETMCLNQNNDYIERIKDALRELMETIELNNWTNPIDGITYNWYATRFLNEASFYKDKETKEWIAVIEPNKTTTNLMKLKENFTELSLLPIMNKLRTRYSVKLYEFFKSFERFRYIDLPQDYLLKILGLQENKTYKSYSAFFRLLQRQIKELNKKTEFENLKMVEPTKQMKKDKYFRFIINPKNKQVLKDKNPDKIKEIAKMTQSIFTRF